MKAAQLYGLWTARFTNPPAGLPERAMLLLDESSDRVSISGTWNGEMVKGSCGKAFQGIWKDTSRSAPDDATGVPFTLTKLP